MVFLVLHILLCVLFFIKKEEYLKNKSTDFPLMIVFILPVFGFIMWWTDYLVVREKRMGQKEVEVEKLDKIDRIYHRLQTEEQKVDQVIPLEDTFLQDDAKLRRSLLLDILHKKPEDYLEVLDRARNIDDVEVTHYATTTLLEIQSDFEQRIQGYKKRLKQKAQNRDFYVEYSTCLKQYIDSGLIDGTVLKMQRENLLQVIEEMRKTDTSHRNDAFLYIETAIDLKKYEKAKRVLDEMENENQGNETWNRLMVRYYWEIGQTEKIHEVLQNIVDHEIYLSKKGKEWFKFWSKGKIYEKRIAE